MGKFTSEYELHGDYLSPPGRWRVGREAYISETPKKGLYALLAPGKRIQSSY